MYLSDKSIIKAVSDSGLIEPFNPANLNPCSYDVTLGDRFIRLDNSKVSSRFGRSHCFRAGYIPEDFLIEIDRTKERVILGPGEFVLATTRETVRLPDGMASQVVGKSSIGRTGLFIHNAGHIDPGFEGQITLELFNAGEAALDLTDVDRIAQLLFIPTDRPVDFAYDGKYQKQVGVTAAREKK